MANLEGVNQDLRRRVEAMLRECPRLWVSSGYRDRKEQEKLYQAFLAGTGNPANRPGTSLHEQGLAVDVACRPSDAGVRAALAKKQGLITPIKGEPWHMQLNPHRSPLMTIAPPAVPKRQADPVLITEYGDAAMHKFEIHVPQLDDKGNGYVDITGDASKIVSFVGQGPNPVRDGYWDAPQFQHQNFEGRVRITITEGRPNGEIRFGVWVLD